MFYEDGSVRPLNALLGLPEQARAFAKNLRIDHLRRWAERSDTSFSIKSVMKD